MRRLIEAYEDNGMGSNAASYLSAVYQLLCEQGDVITCSQADHLHEQRCNVRAVCRAWQLFDWVRTLPEGHSLQRLCDANTYSTMITLCGPWQQLRRALQLVAEMRNRSLECGIQVNHSTSPPLSCSVLFRQCCFLCPMVSSN